jgi:hypothetical protein
LADICGKTVLKVEVSVVVVRIGQGLVRSDVPVLLIVCSTHALWVYDIGGSDECVMTEVGVRFKFYTCSHLGGESFGGFS